MKKREIPKVNVFKSKEGLETKGWVTGDKSNTCITESKLEKIMSTV